ncbi:hypothetical protein KY347_07085 [Candidatus Woesearchaeota archaeon]|nr:hypothetical protein [Candidatus Woesearchaeota archaeon]
MEKDEAIRILADANPEQCFWMNDGQVLKNLGELYKALSKAKKETYKHHVNKEKNDFSNWIRDILGDKKLADDLLRTKSKKDAVAKIRQRLQYLKKAAA